MSDPRDRRPPAPPASSEPAGVEDSERLARVIARTGFASRREAERIVQDGRVEVNGTVVYHPGQPVDPVNAHIRVDGKPLPRPPPLVYYLLFKPRGTITGRDDPDGRDSVLDLVAQLPQRVEPVGRLDYNTEGALLLTNDGDLAHKLTHPSSLVPKRYLAKVWHTPSDKTLERLRRGVILDDGRTAPAQVRIAESTDTGNCWLEITVTEGRNRLVRRMLEAVGHPCSKLRRDSFATISIRGMERGAVRPLTGEEVSRLQDIAEGKDPAKAGHAFRYKKGFARPQPKPNKPLSRKKAQRALTARGKPARPSPSKGPASKGPGSKAPGSKGAGSKAPGSKGPGRGGSGSRGGGQGGGGQGGGSRDR